MTEQTKESVLTDEENNDADVVEIIDAQDDVVENETTVDKSVDITNGEVEKIKQEKEEIKDRYLRLQAEFENFKKRTQREKIAERKYKSQDLATELLPALDNFERALQVEVTDENKSILDGITMVYNQIRTALESADVKLIDSVGTEFDPNLHHAVIQEEDPDFESNYVIEELQKGYILHDRVIRAAMVKVNK